MDHHFGLFPTAEAAFRGSGGIVDEGPFVREVLDWLRELRLR